DAQYFAPQGLLKKNKITSYLEDIALLQRGTGECLITLATRPDISKEILANNGIVLTFKNHLEKDIMCELLNLNIENRKFLSILEEGQCIIRVNSVKEPFLLSVPHIKNELLTFKEIYRNNKQILEKKKGKNNSKSEIKTKYQFLRFRTLRKKLFQLMKKRDKIEEPAILNNIASNSNGLLSSRLSKDKFWEPKVDDKSYEDLKNYIIKLDTMQKEKE
ncbi:MAG: hypothetical protein ACW972_12115, partial [Promethearchaeota archaeon]